MVVCCEALEHAILVCVILISNSTVTQSDSKGLSFQPIYEILSFIWLTSFVIDMSHLLSPISEAAT